MIPQAREIVPSPPRDELVADCPLPGCGLRYGVHKVHQANHLLVRHRTLFLGHGVVCPCGAEFPRIWKNAFLDGLSWEDHLLEFDNPVEHYAEHAFLKELAQQ